MAQYLRIRNDREHRASSLDTMTVGELIEHLRHYDRDMKVIISNDGGFTYGAINEDVIKEIYINDNE